MEAVDNRGSLWKLVGLRNQLLHRQVRVLRVEHGPNCAAAIGLTDQRKKLIVGHDAFGTSHADVNQLFERAAMAECRRVGVQEHEENIVGAGSAAEGVQMV